jgi:N utilization substance protein B
MSARSARPELRAAGARSLARRFAMQALYRLEVNPGPWQDAHAELLADDDMRKTDRDYFESLLRGVAETRDELDARLAPLLDRKPAELDPIEHAVLLVGMHELCMQPDVPFRVVINEAVGLARRYGATDGHKFVNAVLDRAARELRPLEH